MAHYPADTYVESVELTIAASNQLHTVINGDSTTEVAVEDGSKIPSVRKAMVDSLYFKPPIAWAQGKYEDTYNQLREFVDGDVRTWWFAKGATVSTPVLMSTNPATDVNWTLWSAVTLNAATYETQKRLAAEAGLNMVGSFLLGGTVTNVGDVVFYETDGKYYGWGGVLPKTVLSGSTPATTGGIGIGAWSSKVDLTLRDTLTALSGAALITTSENISVQSKLNNIDTELLLKADKTQVDLRVGTAGALTLRNKIVDGRFDFWYEGTSQTTSYYGSDTMWSNRHIGSTKVHSQQPLSAGVDLPAIDVPTAKYFSRTVVTSVAGVGNYVSKVHVIEGGRTLAGKIVTLSFYAKVDSVKNIAIELYQGFGSGGSPSSPVTSIGSQLIGLSTVWKRYTVQIQMPSVSGKTFGTGIDDCIVLHFYFDAELTTWGSRSANLGQQSGTFDIACIQLEEGSVATPFEELPIEVSQKRIERYYEEGMYDSYIGSNYSTAGFISGLILYRTVKRSTPVIYYWGDGIRGTLQNNIQLTDDPTYSSNTLISDRSDSTYLLVIHTAGAEHRNLLRFYYVADARI